MPGPAGKGWILAPFSLERKREQRHRGLSACGKVPNFLLFASASAELIWKDVEDRLGAAILASREGTLLSHSYHLDTIRDCIALHLVRSRRYLELHQSIVAKATEDVQREVLQLRKELLQNHFRRRFGLEPAGEEALRFVLEEPMLRWRELESVGAIARVSMESMFRRIRQSFQGNSIEIWHVPVGEELLVSDSPAFTFRYDSQSGPMRLHVAIGDAHGIAMPIARDCLVAIGPISKDDTLIPEQVSFFNTIQIEIGYDHVYYRPGSRLKTFVENAVNQQPVGH